MSEFETPVSISIGDDESDATMVFESRDDVRAAIDLLYDENLSGTGADTLEALLKLLVQPGIADRVRDVVIAALSA